MFCWSQSQGLSITMAKLLAGSILNLYFSFGPFVKKYSDSNVERLLCITDYRDVTFQCGTYLLLSLVFNEWGFSNKNGTSYLYPLLWKWYVTQSCAEKRAVYQFLFRFGTAVAEKNYWHSVATTKKYSSACFHQMTRKLFPALLTRLSRYWYYFKPYTLTSVGIFFILFFIQYLRCWHQIALKIMLLPILI